MSAICHHQLAAERRPAVRAEQDRATVRATRTTGDIVLEHEELEQLIRRHERGRAYVHESALDTIERGMRAYLVRIPNHVIAAEPPGDDGSQQPGGWLDSERNRHGRRP